MTPRILFSAGDASGDEHGAALARALRGRFPDADLFGLGGPKMAAAGVRLVAPSSALAIGGLVEVVRGLGALRALARALIKATRAEPPDLVVLIDSGGFNLPLARRLKRHCTAPILYFVAPQIWAWRPGRIRKLAARIDRVALILPFEVAAYAQAGLRADFVGHPLVDSMKQWGAAPQSDRERDPNHSPGSIPPTDSRARARAELGLRPDAKVVALMPGSRRNEVSAHGPIQFEVFRRVACSTPGLIGVVCVAPSIDRSRIEALMTDDADSQGHELRIVVDEGRRVMAAADVVLTKPGSVTTEAMLLGTPMVVMARAHPVTAAIVRRALRVPFLAMPNLIAGRAIVPEYWQEAATPEALSVCVGALLEGPAGAAQRRALANARDRLGSGGAPERTADVVEEMLAAADRP